MKSKGIIVLIALLLLPAYMRIGRVECHYAWLDVSPDVVMQGGEFEIRYNVSKFFTSPTGGIVTTKRKMREINISIEIPPSMNCNIKSLDVTGNGTITKEINGLNVMVRASGDIGNLNLIASVHVSLDCEIGTYNIRVTALAREIDEEGNELYPVDYSASEEIKIRTFGPIFSIKAEPKEIDPPHTVGVVVTIMHVEPVPPFNITNLTLRIIPPSPNKPQIIPLVDIFGRSFLRPGRSVRFPRPVYIEIDEKTPGGIHEIRAELEFWVLDRRKVIETSTNITVIKKTEVNISVDVPSEAVNGSELRLNIEVVNIGSFMAKRVIILGKLGEEKAVVEVGNLKPGEFKNVEMILPVCGAGNETIFFRVYWNNEYPHDQVSKSFKFTILVKRAKFNIKVVLALSFLMFTAIIGWLIGKKAVKRSASS